MINIGIVGTGAAASYGWAPAIQQTKGVRLWSVLSRDLRKAEAFARRFCARSPQSAKSNAQSFLEDKELDAVIIATPDKLHAEQAIEAAKARKHILVEKPLATNVSDARTIIRTCREEGVALCIGYQLRWHPGHRILADLSGKGRFGPLRYMRVLWTWQAPDKENWRASSELGRWWSLAGSGTHCIDLVLWLMGNSSGDMVSTSSEMSRNVLGALHDELAVVVLRFESGAVAEICSSVLFNSPSRLELYGSTGYAVAEDTFVPNRTGRLWTDEGPIDFRTRDPFSAALENFAEMTRAPLSSMMPSCRDALINIEIMSNVKSH